MKKALLKVDDLSVKFKTMEGMQTAVQGVSLEVMEGEVFCIVGESGCGKSLTSLSIMGLVEKPGVVSAGAILLDGQDISRMKEDKLRELRGNKMSMIFQEPLTSLNPLFTVGNQMDEVFRLHQKAGRAQAKQMSIDMLRFVGIPDPESVYGRYPAALSGGMRQRVMIAMALITRPEILIADEPTTALDVTVQKQVLDLIKKLQQDMGTSVILITHDLGVVRQYADRINVMYAGRIVESAPAKELLEHPRHAYTRALMKSIPGLHAKGTPLYTIPGLPPNMTQEPCGCSFRPRNTLGNPALCLTGREPELVEISPGHSVQNCPGCLA